MNSISDRPICLSGGADGADLQWGMCAGMAGHIVYHFNFPKHRCKAPKSEQVTLTEEQLLEADPALIRANQTLKRTFPSSSHFVNSLLRRNYWQIRDTERVYAIAGIDPKGIVFGGTSWAVQMFIDRHDGKACEVYVFDQALDRWFTWTGAWTLMDGDPPKPHGVWTGIGSAKSFQPNGKAAIRRLLDYTPPSDMAA